jgi:hypothetical protein
VIVSRARLLLVVALLALAFAGLAIVAGFYQAARHVPNFYRTAIARSAEDQKAAGQQFERTAIDFWNDLRRADRWNLRLSQDEINGWLSAELPAKFPHLLPFGITQPRVAFDDGQFRLAFKHDRQGISSVISLTATIYLTNEPNEIAVRVESVRAGALPVPIGQITGQMTEQAARVGWTLRWTEQDGKPVALIRPTGELLATHSRQAILEALNVRGGHLYIAGCSRDITPAELAGSNQQPRREDAPDSRKNEARQR